MQEIVQNILNTCKRGVYLSLCMMLILFIYLFIPSSFPNLPGFLFCFHLPAPSLFSLNRLSLYCLFFLLSYYSLSISLFSFPLLCSLYSFSIATLFFSLSLLFPLPVIPLSSCNTSLFPLFAFILYCLPVSSPYL